jgi:hypothetical protein
LDRVSSAYRLTGVSVVIDGAAAFEALAADPAR